MIDSVQNYRLDALERAFAALSGGGLTQYNPPPLPAPVYAPQPPSNQQQDARIASLENNVQALSTSVALLNQQVANLAAEFHRRTNAPNMINISPSPTVDTAQDERLDGIDNLVKSLTKNVADYNQQMVDLIAQYKTIKPHMFAAATSNGKANRVVWP